MHNSKIADLNERKIALNSQQSFIIQAPAGSGKTSLLVQRYLKLLSIVNHPEEIVAITFTKKAAFEMRQRIIQALKNTLSNNQSNDPYKIVTYQLAQQALRQDTIKKWNIIQNPNRLRIQTIDAFCHYLVGQSLISTKFDLNAHIVQNQEIEIYYRQAALSLLKSLSEPIDQTYYQYLESLLLYLDNDWERAINLFTSMLKSREQWLPHIVGIDNPLILRQQMEQALQHIATENIQRCITLFPQEYHQELLELLNFSHNNQPLANEITSIANLTNLTVTCWQKIGSIFLTKEFSWRKKITCEHGFPAPSTTKIKEEQKIYRDMKKRMEELLNIFSDHEPLRTSLENLLLIPTSKYPDDKWQIIEALLKLLPLLVAHLKVVLSENYTTDHTEISLAALRALGDEEQPSDLALNLDYKLQHLLIDEFQDTSISHYRLLEKLTTSWQADDGHTIFIVGDPMQSIYRFRDAEVGLFLRVIYTGIGNIKLQPLTLTTNFRSYKNIIAWINTNFAKIMPVFADISLGAIPFRPATATNDDPNAKVNIHIDTADRNQEAQQVILAIKNIIKQYPNDSIAILVKAKNYLKNIIPALRQAKLDYQAFELETMKDNMVIQDLLSLTKALFNLNDRIAWLAILRAPWCGLNLSDLHIIAHGSSAIIWDNICDYQQLNLSQNGKLLLLRLKTSLDKILPLKNRLNTQELIETAWLILGGPATVNNESELEYATQYFELLTDPFDLEVLQKKLENLFISSPINNQSINIMTIHKAKGLEFDHVIIPGIDRTTRTDEHKLLRWFERPRADQNSDLLLAPITKNNNEQDKIYQYLQTVEQKKEFYENGRLLYVAMTRAKKSIHLIGIPGRNISSNSFLEQLKPCLPDSLWQKNSKEQINQQENTTTPPPIIRLTSDWQLPLNIDTPNFLHQPKFVWQDDQKSSIGTIIHHILKQISDTDLTTWDANYILKQRPYWNKLLNQHGFWDLEIGLQLINTAITTTLKDPQGRWILSPHKVSASELAVTTKTPDGFINYIIDRTFIAKDDIRWIIDYKITQPNNNDLLSFMQNEAQKYSHQLLNYAKIMRDMEPERKIKLGLYFPLCGGWIEI